MSLSLKRQSVKPFIIRATLTQTLSIVKSTIITYQPLDLLHVSFRQNGVLTRTVSQNLRNNLLSLTHSPLLDLLLFIFNHSIYDTYHSDCMVYLQRQSVKPSTIRFLITQTLSITTCTQTLHHLLSLRHSPLLDVLKPSTIRSLITQTLSITTCTQTLQH